jgi:hypothetical protein
MVNMSEFGFFHLFTLSQFEQQLAARNLYVRLVNNDILQCCIFCTFLDHLGEMRFAVIEIPTAEFLST